MLTQRNAVIYKRQSQLSSLSSVTVLDDISFSSWQPPFLGFDSHIPWFSWQVETFCDSHDGALVYDDGC